MKQHNYIETLQAIRNRQNFRGNSAYGILTLSGYTIYSYTTLIYSDKAGLNINYYSGTTSRIQNIIANAYYSKTIQQLRKEENTSQNKIIKMLNILKKEEIRSEYCSPNTVANYASQHNIQLTSKEIVYISAKYK
ncbi:hypothetical protein LCGC14_2460680 [marine sediment metagenome]|uniref:Uncharacterized protein n=1 Tax=marine sediment metagenome TaxID=412755 RepID=A0A0F9C118_9ZZZZ